MIRSAHRRAERGRLDSSRIRRTLSAASLCALLLPPAAGAQPEQRVHREGFTEASAAVFSVLTQFYDLDAALPLAPRIVEEWEDETARFAKVVFATSTGERVPLELALPVDAGPVPAVVLVHGLGSARERWWRDDRKALPEGLLTAGIAVATLDLRFHGERAAANDYQSPVYLTFGNELFTRSRDMVIQSTIDVRRALAYLRSRDEVDDTRIAVAGYSMGAMAATFLRVLEPELAATVAAAIPTTEQSAPIDPFHFASRSGVPLLLQIGRDDWLSSPPDIERLYALAGGDANALRWYESGHSLPPQFAEDARAWLVERLAPLP